MILRIKAGQNKDILFVTQKLLELTEGDYTVEVKKRRKIRTISQNRYYWGVVIPYISLELGYSKDDAHEVLARQFLAKTIKLPDGEEMEIARTTTGLDTAEFAQYIDKIMFLASETLGIKIPQAGEVHQDTIDELHNRVEESLAN